MKIVIVVNSFQAGGAERSAIRLATSLSDQNDVIIATFRNDLDHYLCPVNVQRVNLGDIFSHPYQSNIVKMLKGKCRIAYTWFLKIKDLRRKIKRINPDVVIAFEALPGSVIAASLALSKVPVIVSERVNPDPQVYRPHIIAQVFRPIMYRHGVVCSVQGQEFAKWVKECWKIDAVVTPNHLLEKEYVFPLSKKFESRFVCVGRYAQQKGLDTLLAAWKIVETEHPNVSLSLFGAGNALGYKEIASNLKLKTVQFFGPREDMKRVYGEADCLISASNFEGFPNVVIESLAHGVPVISTRSTPILLEFEDKHALRVVEPGDEKALAREILERIKKGVSPELQKRAFEIARRYSWEKASSSWESAIRTSQVRRGLTLRRAK
jgi:glycosyltransferase involved in cell wall biosynthesis